MGVLENRSELSEAYMALTLVRPVNCADVVHQVKSV